MKPALLTLALLVVPSVAHAAGGIGTVLQKSLGSERTVAKDGLRSSGAPATSRRRISTDRSHCFTVTACRKALRWQKANRRHLRHLLTVRFRDTVNFAVTLAARAYHLDEAKALSVAWCESRLNPFATNGQYAGLFQIGPRVNSTPFAGLDLRNPFVNALAAGAIVTQDGGSWREWTCG